MSAPEPFTPVSESHPSSLGPALTRASEILALAGGALMLVVACARHRERAHALAPRRRHLRRFRARADRDRARRLRLPAALPGTSRQRHRRHLHGRACPGARAHGLDALWDLVYARIIAIIAWRLVVGARDAFASQTTSMVLGIPHGYAIAACAAMGVFLSIVAVATARRVAGAGR